MPVIVSVTERNDASTSDVNATAHAGAVGIARAGRSSTGAGTWFQGTYGALLLNPDGTLTYRLDNSDPDTNALGAGQIADDRFTYTWVENGVVHTDTIIVRVAGIDEPGQQLTTGSATINYSSDTTIAALQQLRLPAQAVSVHAPDAAYVTLTNRGMIHAEAANSEAIGIRTDVDFPWSGSATFLNFGLVEAHAGPSAHQAIGATGSSGPGMINSIVVNHGVIRAVSDATDDYSQAIGVGTANVVNTGTIEAISTGEATGASIIMYGRLENSGYIYAEGHTAMYERGIAGVKVAQASKVIIVNSGTIHAVSTTAIQSVGITMFRDSTNHYAVGRVDNSGTIVADIAIQAYGTSVGGITGLHAYNSGHVEGAFDMDLGMNLLFNQAGGSWIGAVRGGFNEDSVRNRGLLDGLVSLGDARDLFDGRGGAQTGQVSGDGGDDTLLGGDGADNLAGGNGADFIAGGGGADTLSGGAGADVFAYLSSGDSTVSAQDTISDFQTGSDRLDLGAVAPGSVSLATSGGFTIVTATTAGGTVSIRVGGTIALSDIVTAPKGALLTGTDGTETLLAVVGGSQLEGMGGDDVLEGSAGDDQLNGGAGADLMRGGAGNDIYYSDVYEDRIVEFDGEGTDELRTSASQRMNVNIENLTMLGSGNIFASGNDLANIITGNSGWNEIYADRGDDVIIGGGGADTLMGGEGNDLFVYLIVSDSVSGAVDYLSDFDTGNDMIDLRAVSPISVTIQETMLGYWQNYDITNIVTVQTAAGTITIKVHNKLFLSDFLLGNEIVGTLAADILNGTGAGEVLIGGAGDDVLAGLGGADTLSGQDGDDRLDGGAGIDVMTGGRGNDVYIVDNGADSVWEMFGEGYDTLMTSVSYTLASIVFVERLETMDSTGTAAINLTGNIKDNMLVGNAGNNILDGGVSTDPLTFSTGGFDRFVGNGGDDVMIVDGSEDVVTEQVGGGLDTVIARLSYVLTASAEVEVLMANPAASQPNYFGGVALNLTGNEFAQTLRGNSEINNLDGKGGADIFLFQSVGESTSEKTDRIVGFESGVDRIDLTALSVSSISWTEQTDSSGLYSLVTVVAPAGEMKIRVDGHVVMSDFLVSRALIAGGEGADSIVGSGGGDEIHGNGGDDSLRGLTGNDLLNGGGGTDTAIFWGKSSDYDITGEGEVVVRDRNPSNGDEGTDILIGVEYIQFADIRIQIGPLPNNLPQLGDPAMVDQIWADGHAASYTIPGTSFVDVDGNHTLTFTASLSNGSPLPSWLSFDPSLRTFSGTPPLDQVGETLEIKVIASDSAASVSDNFLLGVTQAPGADVEGTNGADTLAGTFRDEIMIGLDGNDKLRGSLGADQLNGGGGTDEADYSDSSQGVTVDLTAGVGHGGHAEGDELISIEGVRGSAFDDILFGTAGADLLDGGGGADRLEGGIGPDSLFGGSGDDLLLGGGDGDILVGGPGDDIYLVDDAGDSITELPGEGNDEVRTGLSSYALSANVEKLTGTSATGQALSGNGLDNTIFGGTGNDLLDGGAGVDVLRGGIGNDVYVIDETGDNVAELADWGTDEVRTGLGYYALADHFENLTGTSSSGQMLVGNALSNFILGGSGNDVVDGGAGADLLRGGLGNDIYLVDDVGDNIDELPEGGIDEVRTGLAAFSLFALGTFENLTGTSSRGQILEGNGLANVIVAGAGNDLLYGAGGADTLRGGLGNDVYFVDEAGDAVIELTGEGSDEIRTSLVSYSLATLTNVENLTGLGNGDQSLTGNGAANVIDGGLGADTMTGGLGNDIYIVDNIGDAVIELSGEGNDEIRTSLGTYSMLGLANVENLTATSNVNHDFRGNAGNNVVTGAGGNDFLRLQDGGNDTVLGGGGNDVILFGATLTSADSVDGGTGIDQAVIQGDYSGGLTLGANFVSIESFAILPGSDTRFGDPGTSFYDYNLTTVNGNVAAGVTMVVDANRLRIGEDFTFNGSAETDGGFFIYGGGGTDTLLGGSGNDTFYFGENGQFGASDTANGGAGGIDQLGLRGNYTITFGAGQLTSIESMGLVSAQDTRFGGLGTAYNYNLTMNDGNVAAGVRMTVDAAPLRGAETLTFDGSAEADGSFRIFGGQGGDTIKGSQSSDLITGGTGADNLWGSGGNDSFIYRSVSDSTSTARDTIHDFSSGDLINLVQIDAVAGGGNDAFTFIGSGAFSNTAGELRAVFDAVNNVWTVQGDVNGDGLADIEILVTSDHSLVGADFVL